MFAGDFQRKLRRVNPRLKIFCGDDDSKPAGIFTIKRGPYGEDLGGSYEAICGVDKSIVPEHTVLRADGSIEKSGWRRVLRILIAGGYVDRRTAERVFGCRLGVRTRKPRVPKAVIDRKGLLADYAKEIRSWGGTK